MKVHVFPPNQQGKGSFDHGKFIEQRPIGFPGDQSAVERVGPLFYWAWGKAIDIAEIGMHPHQAFEIMTYVLKGTVEHQDSLGTKQLVTEGGAQVMQAGSGIYHAEAFREVNSEGFQIWFEPHIREALKRSPTYHQYTHHQFPIRHGEGFSLKTVIGDQSPISLITDVVAFDMTIQPGSQYTYALHANRALTFLSIEGSGQLIHPASTLSSFDSRDFVCITSDQNSEVHIQSSTLNTLRIFTIEVPTQVNYPLYQK